MQTATPAPTATEPLVWCDTCGNYTARDKVDLCACGVWRRRVCTRDPGHDTVG